MINDGFVSSKKSKCANCLFASLSFTSVSLSTRHCSCYHVPPPLRIELGDRLDFESRVSCLELTLKEALDAVLQRVLIVPKPLDSTCTGQ